jgi:bacterioferritin-associated ferredoxin
LYACICWAVTADELSAAIDEGAETVESVGRVTGAGTCCGTCQVRIESMLSERGASCPVAALRAS